MCMHMLPGGGGVQNRSSHTDVYVYICIYVRVVISIVAKMISSSNGIVVLCYELCTAYTCYSRSGSTKKAIKLSSNNDIF